MAGEEFIARGIEQAGQSIGAGIQSALQARAQQAAQSFRRLQQEEDKELDIALKMVDLQPEFAINKLNTIRKSRHVRRTGKLEGFEPIPMGPSILELARSLKELRKIPQSQEDFAKNRNEIFDSFENVSAKQLKQAQEFVIKEEKAEREQVQEQRKAVEFEQKQQFRPELREQENKLRTQFLKQSQDFIKIRDAFDRVQASAEEPSPAGQLALVFNFMKILDPGSVVRESEFANAANAGGVPEKIRRIHNNLLRTTQGKGAFLLSMNQQRDFVNRANKLFERQRSQHTKRSEQFTSLAQRQGLNPENVVLDVTPISQEKVPQNVTLDTDLSTLSDEQLKAIAEGRF